MIIAGGPFALLTRLAPEKRIARGLGFAPMNDFTLPETCYALSGDINIAYQVMGDGPLDIILVPGLCSHIEFLHELPGYTAFLRRLSNFARVITFDKRGQGLSDRMSGAPSLEQRMDDVRAIMDDIGSQRAVLLGFSEGCPMSILFAATYPERVSHLVSVWRLCACRRALAAKPDAGSPRSWPCTPHQELGQRRDDENCSPKPGDGQKCGSPSSPSSSGCRAARAL